MFGRHAQKPGRLITLLAALHTSLIEFALPSLCPLCGRLIHPSNPHVLCPSCLSGVRFIKPPLCLKCGIPFASDKEEDHLCGRCLQGMAFYGVARAVCTFSGSIRQIIHAFKYEGRTRLARTLVALMEEGPLPLNISRYDRLIPVPLHRNRLRKRGYNQALLLARELNRRSRVPIDRTLLRRSKDSPPQIALTGSRREENVKGVFSLEGEPRGMTLLLIDDVFTTGATANECARVLMKGRARRVDILTIARVV